MDNKLGGTAKTFMNQNQKHAGSKYKIMSSLVVQPLFNLLDMKVN